MVVVALSVGAASLVGLWWLLGGRQFELYGLDHVVLNVADAQYWLNMGYWESPADTFGDAARALADRVGKAARLHEASVLMDVGCGCAEPDLHWARKHRGLRHIVGITNERTQVLLAQARIQSAGMTDRITIQQGDASALASARLETPFDAVISLDSAYHYNTRQAFFAGSFALLRSGGHLGMSDIVVDAAPQHWLARLLLWLAHRGAFVPAANLITIDAYRAQLQSAGFQDVELEDISPRVFVPLSHWMDRQVEMFAPILRPVLRVKYRLMARALRAIDQQHLFKFIVVSARKP